RTRDEGRRTKDEGRRTRDEGRGTKDEGRDEGRRTKDEGRRTKDEGRGTKDEGRGTKDEGHDLDLGASLSALVSVHPAGAAAHLGPRAGPCRPPGPSPHCSPSACALL
ncbi:hypothetical protein BC831DRAFT_555368, partial [Entophlyctis helioformis]